MIRQPPTAAANGQRNFVGGQNGESPFGMMLTYTADSVLLFKKLIKASPASSVVKTKLKLSARRKSRSNIATRVIDRVAVSDRRHLGYGNTPNAVYT